MAMDVQLNEASKETCKCMQLQNCESNENDVEHSEITTTKNDEKKTNRAGNFTA